MPLPFTPSPRLSLGAEVELQILDAATRDLAPRALDLFQHLPATPRITPEIFQSMIEVNTAICASAQDVRRDLRNSVAALMDAGAPLGLAFATAGSHPFARCRDRTPFPSERYQYLVERNQWIARRLMIFGLHVHVGMRDGDHAMAMINGLLPYAAHLLALSASSPFWEGDDTGLASSRITIFEAMPTAGVPTTFETWAAFERFFDTLVATGSIGSLKDLWWDMRPHPDFGTIEIRVCDGLPTISEAAALVALVHALIAWLDQRYRAGERLPPPAAWVLRENKWRAGRWGLDTEIVREDGTTRPLRADIEELLATLEPLARDLGATDGLRIIDRLLREGPSYARQRATFARTGRLEAVAEALVEELAADVANP